MFGGHDLFDGDDLLAGDGLFAGDDLFGGDDLFKGVVFERVRIGFEFSFLLESTYILEVVEDFFSGCCC